MLSLKKKNVSGEGDAVQLWRIDTPSFLHKKKKTKNWHSQESLGTQKMLHRECRHLGEFFNDGVSMKHAEWHIRNITIPTEGFNKIVWFNGGPWTPQYPEMISKNQWHLWSVASTYYFRLNAITNPLELTAMIVFRPTARSSVHLRLTLIERSIAVNCNHRFFNFLLGHMVFYIGQWPPQTICSSVLSISVRVWCTSLHWKSQRNELWKVRFWSTPNNNPPLAWCDACCVRDSCLYQKIPDPPAWFEWSYGDQSIFCLIFFFKLFNWIFEGKYFAPCSFF